MCACVHVCIWGGVAVCLHVCVCACAHCGGEWRCAQPLRCASIHAYVHTHMSTCACVHVCMHTRTHAYLHACIPARIHACTHAHMHVHAGVRLLSCSSGGGVATCELRAPRPAILRASGAPQTCACAFDGGGGLTAGSDGLINVWDGQKLLGRRGVESEGGEGGGSAVRSMHLWLGGEMRIVTGHANGHVCWWGQP